MKLTESIHIKKTAPLRTICHHSKNLYNRANFIVRQTLFETKKWTRYRKLYSLLKDSNEYKILPAQSAQQTLKLLDKNWKAFFRAIKDWKLHPEKYLERPRPPKYKSKNGETIVIFTNQSATIKDGFIIFPRKTNLPPIKTRVNEFRQIRILPRGLSYIVEVIYNKDPINLELDKYRILGIDLGLRNLVTCVNNIGVEPFIIKGGVAKSINQFYNKQKAYYQSLKDLQRYRFETSRLRRLALKRNNKIKDIFHKISRYIINYCITNNIGTIVIGYNPDWKQSINLGRRNNQNFVSIPFQKLVQMIQYKFELVCGQIILVDEAHTSKCSFYDNELIAHRDRYSGRRISRGLFKTSTGRVVNADVNGAYNIVRKASPEALADGVEVAVGHPYPVLIAG